MKDSFYFQHDYFARNDPKLVEVMMAHGMAGIGVFWCVIEMLYEQGGKLPVSSCKSIAFALHVDCKMVESVMQDFGLFETNGEFFTSPSVTKRNQKRLAIAEKRKNAALSRWENANADQTDASASNSDANADGCNAIINDKDVNINEDKKGNKAKRTAFVPPTIEEVNQYLIEKGIANVDAQRFVDFYESKGWMVGKNKMKDWRAAVRTWSRDDRRTPARPSQTTKNANDEWN